MATIYPFSIYTSQGKVYPASSGPSYVVDLNFLGWTPTLVGAQLESVDKIMTNKTFDIPNWDFLPEHYYYMFPDLTNVDISDWDYSSLNFYNQPYMLFPNNISFDLDDFDVMYKQAFSGNKFLKNITFSGKCAISDQQDEPQDSLKIYAMFAECDNLQSVTGLDLSDYTYLSAQNMFSECHNLSALTNCSFPSKLYGDNSNMFKNCGQLTSIPTITDTSDVTNFDHTFASTSVTSYSNTFDLTNCTNTTCMFSNNYQLTSTPTITNMTEDVTSFDGMFENIGLTVWMNQSDPEQEIYYTPTDSVTIKFAADANSTNAFYNAYLIGSITVNTENMPTGQFLNPQASDRNWLSQLTIYVPSTKVQDWIDFLKSDCGGDPDLELMMESIVQAIS